MTFFETTFAYKLIYIFRINDDAHKNLLKIGEATCFTEEQPAKLLPNCNRLNVAAKNRINEYTQTAGIKYELLHTELAMRRVVKDGKSLIEAFRDHDVHQVLIRSGIKRHFFDTEHKANEWFGVDLETAKKAISAVKEGRSSLLSSEITESKSPIVFRPEQADAIKRTIKQFKTGNQMLWNAKMRFGKTLTALQVAKECEFKHTLILTHRPVVRDGWFEDFGKIFYDTDYVFGSKTNGEKIEDLVNSDKKFVYFASMQDLRGSDAVGGKFDKNEDIFHTKWDFVVIDEAHEGTLTKLGQAVIETINEMSNYPKILRLSGTPFNLLDKFKEAEIFTWDYVMEQREKKNWLQKYFGDANPYADLPELKIFTYNLDKLIGGYIDVEDGAFNFREFFRTWTGNVQKDFKPMPDGVNVGDFVHKTDVRRFLDLLCKSDKNSNYPFSTEEYRAYFRHSLWMVPGVKEAKALSALLKAHPAFGSGAFNIVNVAGSGDEEIDSKDALDAVRHAFGSNPDETYSITISCGRLTTGVTVPEWTAVFMLAGTFSTSASSYLQTIFRVQSPANINGKVKERCFVFDFAPDRTLKMVAEAGRLSTKTGNTSNDRKIMGEFLNYCPVIAVEGSNMRQYNVDSMLQQLKKAYTDRVVRNGFDDKNLYNDNLLKLDDIELADFEALKKIVGASKQTEKVKDIDINRQGFTDEEYEQLQAIEAKPKKERTPEEIAFLEEKKKKRDNAQKAMSILRGVSIRIPLLIYGAEVPADKEITVDNFVDLVDDSSWNEFMPAGVTKETYKKFSKYYEQDVFVAAGRQIRNIALAADELSPDERVKKIADQFAMFKNPDKETVLTPWRVVNMHMSDCLGGYCFYNEDFTETIEEPRFVDRGKVTQETFANINAQILEINSKTGLYPLYVVYSIYRKRCETVNAHELTIEKQYQLWQKTVEDNIFVICKTPMAKAITRRTLLGYRKGKLNAHAFDDLIMQLKEKPDQFKEKVLRGSFWKKECNEMKFDAVVGNPPYQISDGGGTGDSAMPVYNFFVGIAKKLNAQYVSMITPSRWMKGGKGLQSFRKEMIEDERLSSITDYANANYCFNGIHIDGGVSYFLWDKKHKGALVYKYTSLNGETTVSHRLLKTDFNNTVIRDIRQASIVQKVANSSKFSEIVSFRNPYGIGADIFNNPQKYSDILSETDDCNHYKIYGVKGIKGGAKRISAYVKKDAVKPNAVGADLYKIFFSKAYMTTSTVPPALIMGEPMSVCSETFLQIGPFQSKECQTNCAKYIQCKFFRALLFFNRSSLNISNSTFELAPLQDFTEHSDIDWSKSVEEIDQQLYKKYNLTDEEITFIESMIKPME